MSNTNRAIPRYFLQIGIFVLLFAASLFFSAGRTDWAMGWVFITIVAASQLSIALILMMRNPELMGERTESKGKRDLDRILAGVMALFGPISMCIVAGLNMRFGWLPQISFALQITGIVLTVLGAMLTALGDGVKQVLLWRSTNRTGGRSYSLRQWTVSIYTPPWLPWRNPI